MPRRICPSCESEYEFVSIAAHKSFPFCSERCRFIDLGKWYAEEHTIEQPIGPDELEEYQDELLGEQSLHRFAGEGDPTADDDDSEG